MVVKDSLEAVRPKEKFPESYLEANQNAIKLTDEFKEKLCKFLGQPQALPMGAFFLLILSLASRWSEKCMEV